MWAMQPDRFSRPGIYGSVLFLQYKPPEWSTPVVLCVGWAFDIMMPFIGSFGLDRHRGHWSFWGEAGECHCECAICFQPMHWKVPGVGYQRILKLIACHSYM
jgi:hypothetical protein